MLARYALTAAGSAFVVLVAAAISAVGFVVK
jgi:hypothetical protein